MADEEVSSVDPVDDDVLQAVAMQTKAVMIKKNRFMLFEFFVTKYG